MAQTEKIRQQAHTELLSRLSDGYTHSPEGVGNGKCDPRHGEEFPVLFVATSAVCTKVAISKQLVEQIAEADGEIITVAYDHTLSRLFPHAVFDAAEICEVVEVLEDFGAVSAPPAYRPLGQTEDGPVYYVPLTEEMELSEVYEDDSVYY